MDIKSDKKFTDIEKEVLAYWKSNECFYKANEKSKNKKRFTFYDGPPFATGLPHYGHILSGTIKDVITRYKYQHGYHVDRRFGWDCHGLPVEYEIDKSLGITNRQQIEEMGIDKYNNKCRSIVMKYSSQWKSTVERMGRWVDFDNGYKTMDVDFMESVWYIFSLLYSQDSVYRGYKVMPFSTGCMTPLSNFESNLNYKMVNDPSVIIAFPLKQKFCGEHVCILAWTTTPWTLISNCALVLNKNLEYALVKINDKFYVMLESRLNVYFANFEIVKKLNGGELVGLDYEQPFGYFEKFRKNGFFKILDDNFVSAENGTGIVHTAPGFGEEDYNCFVRNGLIKVNDLVPCPVDENGNFTKEITEFAGLYIKDADKLIMKALGDKILYKNQISHSYPFCWRSEKPLIYKLVPNWFVKVSDSINRLLENNDKIHWVPNEVKEKRFHNWLANAKDWAISRNRFWGTPIPLWVSEDYSEIICVKSVEELCSLSGRTITDIHREFIDDIVIKKNGKFLRRIPEVFDCWFESGSMPYAQNHWPFCLKHKYDMSDIKKELDEGTNDTMYDKLILQNFPADFIGEGIDQTRGWFYTLHVISTLLFNKPAFRNVIVNGIVLAVDGKKMSKKEKNYPDPNLIFDKYGADSLRLYLISSPVVEAQDLKFREEGVHELLKTIIIPWSNILRFYLDASKATDKYGILELDNWIINKYNGFLQDVTLSMDKYEMNSIATLALKFIDELSNWYIRIYRKEIKEGHTKLLKTLLVNFSIIMAPFTPFYSEYCYRLLSNDESVHYEMYPEKIQSEKDTFDQAKEIIEGIRYIRENNQISLKTPLRKVIVICDSTFSNDANIYESVIVRECNVIKFTFCTNNSPCVKVEVKVKPRFEILKKDMKNMNAKIKIIRTLQNSEIEKLQDNDIQVNGCIIKKEDVLIERTAISTYGLCKGFSNFILHIDNTMDDEVLEKKNAREFYSHTQKVRKGLGLKPEDTVYIEVDDDYLVNISLKYYDMLFGTEGNIVDEHEYCYDNKTVKIIVRNI